MESGVFKCKNCGASLDLSKAVNGVVECEYCNSIFTVPKKEASSAALDFLRQGEHELDTCKFEEAYSAFYKAWDNDRKEPEAFWGMALAEFKVRYIKDIVNNRLQPICQYVSEKNFCDSKNYKCALQLATPKQRVEYEKKAAEIDYIKNEFYKLKNSGLDYDCFICVKVTGENGEKTDDYKDADYIYTLLKDKGFKPFFSERDIRNKTGADYEAMILYALYTAETMLVVCRNENFLQTPWVKNEYTRFLKLVNDEEKESDSITIVYYGNPIERLEGKNGKIQGIDFSRREADGKIVDFVEMHTPLAKAKREEEKRKREAQAEEIRNQIEAQKQAQKALEEKLKNLNSNTVAGATSTVESLLTRANQEMDAYNFERAKTFYETILERAPENALAWWGLFLCEINCTNEENIDSIDFTLLEKIEKSKNYSFALRYASGETKIRIDNFNDRVKEFVEVSLKSDERKKESLFTRYQTEKSKYNDNVRGLREKVTAGRATACELMKKVPSCPDFDFSDFPIIAILIIGAVIAAVACIAWFVGFIYISYNISEEQFAEMSSWLTWGNYELSSFTSFILAIAKSIAYGLFAGVIFYSIVLIVVIIILIVNGIRKINYNSKSERSNAYSGELQNVEGDLKAVEDSFKSYERAYQNEICKLQENIEICKKFLNSI